MGDDEDIGQQLLLLEKEMLAHERQCAADIARVAENHRADATNLSHYVAFRLRDLRTLQRELGELGLSSLGRSEAHTLATVESVRSALGCAPPTPVPASLSFRAGRAALDRNTDVLFGPRPHGRVPRVMVTLPTMAASDHQLVRHLVASGMDVARINGAHDEIGVWERMVHNVRKAAAAVDRSCRICIDLPGPKLRTGPLMAGPHVLRLRPRRDLRGVPLVPATAFVGQSVPVGDDRPVVPVEPQWVVRRTCGEVITLVDTRGSRRQLRVAEKHDGAVLVEAWDTTYLESGMELACGADVTRIRRLDPIPQFHLLEVGDRLRLTRGMEPAPAWSHGQPGTPRIGCSLPAAFETVRPGQCVVLDDGKMTGTVEEVDPSEMVVRVTTASPHGSKLRAEKGINFPSLDLRLDVVDDHDLPLLALAAQQADMVALSFLRNERDVDAMHRYLTRVGGTHLGLVLKIETQSAFMRLPEILMHAMRLPAVGVMIARGDLAAEVGYERLAELQEEILWLSEAAHLPVIWATQVLDQLARTGMPSRAEVTDAAMGQRAECVMLNKGPHVDTAIVVLDDILRRMSGHQRKKASLLRPLHSWRDDPDAP